MTDPRQAAEIVRSKHKPGGGSPTRRHTCDILAESVLDNPVSRSPGIDCKFILSQPSMHCQRHDLLSVFASRHEQFEQSSLHPHATHLNCGNLQVNESGVMSVAPGVEWMRQLRSGTALALQTGKSQNSSAQPATKLSEPVPPSMAAESFRRCLESQALCQQLRIKSKQRRIAGELTAAQRRCNSASAPGCAA